MKRLTRTTKETRVSIERSATPLVKTAYPFFDHMVTTFLFTAELPLAVSAEGDLRHHVMEDVALTLGEFVHRGAPERARRYGHALVPMDDALVEAVLDAGGRAYFAGKLPMRLYTHWFSSFATASKVTLHVRVLDGVDRHHVVEAAFKATGFALKQALASEGRLWSTKGTVTWEEEA